VGRRQGESRSRGDVVWGVGVAGAVAMRHGIVRTGDVVVIGAFDEVPEDLFQIARKVAISASGRKLPRNRPQECNCRSQPASLTSVLRPGTFLA
jgi:hypothetical protein